VNRLKRILAQIDGFQRRHGAMGFPYAVVKKFGDDRAGQLAALVAYYAFFSLFPLLLVLITVLGLILQGENEVSRRVVDAAVSQFPVIGEEIRNNIGSLQAKGVALAIGLAGALWAGLGVFKVAQNAMNEAWDVPLKRQPNFLITLLRAVLMLFVLGGFLIASSALASGATQQGDLDVVRLLFMAASVAVNVVLFTAAFKLLTVENVTVRQVLPGAALAAVLWSALQALGTYYVDRQLQGASEVYGLFAMVIGLLSWIYLGAQLTILCAELNVVRVKRLWPRSLTGDDLTDADRRALERYAHVEERRPDEKVDVRFTGEAAG
jgi:membrane protein